MHLLRRRRRGAARSDAGAGTGAPAREALAGSEPAGQRHAGRRARRSAAARGRGAHGRIASVPSVSGPGGAFPSTQGALWLFLAGRDPGESCIQPQARRRARRALPHRRGCRDVPVRRRGATSAATRTARRIPRARACPRWRCRRQGRGWPAAASSPPALGASISPRLEKLSGGARPHHRPRSRIERRARRRSPFGAREAIRRRRASSPTAFMVRRSMPWGDVREHGLYFVAYAASLDPYERVLRRMLGLDDGIVDGMVPRFTRPASGGYYWCRPGRRRAPRPRRAVGIPGSPPREAARRAESTPGVRDLSSTPTQPPTGSRSRRRTPPRAGPRG